MASYIGKVQIANNSGTTTALVGSTLYGICGTNADTALKDITALTNGANTPITGDYVNTSYDNLIRGSTIHIKFINGNTVTTGASLKVGTLTTTQNVVGNFTCPANTIISFTLDENQNWVVNDNVDTNTEYVFKSAYNATTNRVLGEADVGDAAEKDVVTALTDTTTATDLPTANAVVQYVQLKTAGLSGLTGAMHFRGSVNTLPEATSSTTFSNYDNGDVVLGPNDKEYVYAKGADAASSEWIELGDEGSYVLQTSQTTDIIDEVTNWSDGTLPQLTVTDTTVSNVSVTTAGAAATLTPQQVTVPNVTQAGTATTASVSAGILNINIGQDTTLGTAVQFDAIGSWTTNTPTVVSSTPVTVGSASGWNAGTKPTLTQTPTTVVVPVTQSP